MSRTLPQARQAFATAIERDTPGTDMPRFITVLDALVAWSVARPDLLAFRDDEKRSDTISFELVGSKVVLWSAQAARGAGPKLEIYPPTGRSLSEPERATVMQTLNAHSREVLVEGDRLRIGFGALKNVAARTAVLNLMEQLLATSAQSTGATPSGAKAASPS